MDKRFWMMLVRVEILKRQVLVVAHVLERLQYRGPICRTVQQGAERFERVIGALLRILFQVDVLDSLTED